MTVAAPHAHPHPAKGSVKRTIVPVIAGDGIGSEVVDGVRRVLTAIGEPVELIELERDAGTGLPSEAGLKQIQQYGLLLKGPLATPLGGGRKSPNVTLRKLLDLHANVRPSRAIAGVQSPLATGALDTIIVRENLEDVYSGVEHAQTTDVFQCLKLITRSGSRLAARTAFEVAVQHGRRRVTCVSKSNIMKLTDGAFVEEFRRVASDYPQIETDELLVDAAACRMVTNPDDFDVIFTGNLYGDILSDLAAGISGGLGLAASANVGTRVALFEPVHGTAPDIAGTDAANPTAMILSAALMLRHIGALGHAAAIEQAVDDVYREGRVRTIDMRSGDAAIVGCMAFADAIGARAATLVPTGATVPSFAPPQPIEVTNPVGEAVSERCCVGADVFVEHHGSVEELAASLIDAAATTRLTLKMLSNRGVQVWPALGAPRLVDHFRCRFVSIDGSDLDQDAVTEMLARMTGRSRWTHVEQLHQFNGAAAFSLAYGEQAPG